MFKRKKSKNKETKVLDNTVYKSSGGFNILKNNMVTIVSNACSECYDTHKTRTFEERESYISKRIATGHESILEHSNLVMLLHSNDAEDIIKLLPYLHFLNVKTIKKDDTWHILIGGSIRGYKHIIRSMDYKGSALANAILMNLYSTNSCFFGDFIDNNILKIKGFLNEDESKVEYEPYEQLPYIVRQLNCNEYYDIENVDNVQKIISRLIDMGLYDAESLTNDNLFTFNDLLDMVTITIHWKKVSRIISQQLTRHRVGITQMSQRYVDFSNVEFHAPSKFKPEKYDKTTIYTLIIKNCNGEDLLLSGTMQELGDNLTKIYNQLVEQGLTKEDARAYLMNNVNTSLYMTYTLRQLLHSECIRDDSHAQAEIHMLFHSLKYDIDALGYNYEELNKYLLPLWEIIELDANKMYDEIDEIVED